MQFMVWVWLVTIVIFIIVEAMTAGLVSVWFSVGALAALIAAQLDLTLTTQIVVFAVVSALALALTRPMVKKYQKRRGTTPTNADRLLGKTGRVTESIHNEIPQGAVYADGKTWTARSEDGTVIPEGTTVRIIRMEGVKLYVTPVEERKEHA